MSGCQCVTTKTIDFNCLALAFGFMILTYLFDYFENYSHPIFVLLVVQQQQFEVAVIADGRGLEL